MKEMTAFRMAPDIMKAMRSVKAKEGIPLSVQIDFALRGWLAKKGVKIADEHGGPKRRRSAKGR